MLQNYSNVLYDKKPYKFNTNLKYDRYRCVELIRGDKNYANDCRFHNSSN